MKGLTFTAIAFILFLAMPVAGDYNGAESLNFKVYALSNDSAIVSASYTPYAPGMCPGGCGCALVPVGFCCLLANFLINEDNVTFLGFSDELQIHKYSGSYYIFAFAHGVSNDTLMVYRFSTGEIEIVENISTNWLYGDFAVSMPYFAVRLDREKVLVYEITMGKSRILTIDEVENGSIPGIKVEKHKNTYYLSGRAPLGPESGVRGELDREKISFGGFSIPTWAVENYTISPIEMNHLYAFRLEGSYLIAPVSLMHYFAPCENSTGEVVKFGNDSSTDFSPDVYVFIYQDRKVRPVQLLRLDYERLEPEIKLLNWITINDEADKICGIGVVLLVTLLPLLRKNF
ncbi:hypothetical protein [Thermococcus sp. 2319x1]|uniref:hypothetical protein n=1 Tax=Thermococcus sp. 2319x1 TaxID=1674923 RepID=UPI0015839CF2|nr:hypothetical protein [Thermococcus sp. 2319x1]